MEVVLVAVLIGLKPKGARIGLTEKGLALLASFIGSEGPSFPSVYLFNP